MKLSVILIILFILVSQKVVSAHPGSLDSGGGHKCWTNCEQWGLTRGEYHYHNPDGSIRKTAVQNPVVQITTTPVVKISTPSIPLPTTFLTATPTILPATTTVSIQPTNSPSPIVADEQKNEGNGMGGLLTLGILGGLGYFGYKKIKKKRTKPTQTIS